MLVLVVLPTINKHNRSNVLLRDLSIKKVVVGDMVFVDTSSYSELM